MISRTIAQALVGDGTWYGSDNFDDAWRTEIERIVAAYALPPTAVCPECLFVVPFAAKHVAVVSVAGRKFRFLILERRLYNVIPDPFALAALFPPRWDAPAPLPALEWPEELLPKRTIAQLDAIFKHGDGPLLLGACQTLVDTGRIALVRPEPANDFCRDLWALLPDSTRRTTWLATFGYALTLPFGLVVLPSNPEPLPAGFLTEDQTRDYPESRYERELQTAVECGDQRAVDRLLARRSSAETLRLALWIVLALAVVSIALRIIMAR